MDRHDQSSTPANGPLRVALFSGAYDYIADGISLTLNRLVEDLEHDGVEVIVFAPTATQAAFSHAGTLVSVPSIPIPGRPEYRLALGIGRSAKRRLAAFRPNLFHIAVPDYLGFRSLRLARRWRVPVIASYHTRYETYLTYYGMEVFRPISSAYLRRFFAACDIVCAPSPSMADQLEADGYGSDVRIWGRGVDTVRFNPGKRSPEWRRNLGIGDEEVVVVFVSRLVREKDLDTLANVTEAVERRGALFRCLVVGDGPDRGFLEGRLPRAIFTGSLGGDELARAYASSDIFLFPSVTETFGNVTLEAMASGLPAVCANATGSRSLVVPGASGFLATPRNTDEFAGYLERLISSDDLRRRMGAAALARSATYTRANAYRQLRSVYDELLGADRS